MLYLKLINLKKSIAFLQKGVICAKYKRAITALQKNKQTKA